MIFFPPRGDKKFYIISQCMFRRDISIEITLRHRCSTVNPLPIVRAPFSKNISGGLPIHILTEAVS